jgi:hypothetical protein
MENKIPVVMNKSENLTLTLQAMGTIIDGKYYCLGDWWFEINEHELISHRFDELPEWLKNRIEESRPSLPNWIKMEVGNVKMKHHSTSSTVEIKVIDDEGINQTLWLDYSEVSNLRKALNKI